MAPFGRRACVALLFALAGVCACCWAQTVGAAPARTWHTVQSAHYEVSSDLGPVFTALVARHMEAIHREYELRFRGYGSRGHERFQVKVYARREDYDAAVPAPLRGSAGAFISGQRLLATFKGERTDEAVFRTLYHEGFHQFLHSCVARNVPMWLNEGFAEYFAEATWNGERFTTGRVPWVRLHVLRKAMAEGSYIPLRRLFAMGNREWLARAWGEEGEGALQYCEAWSVVHFLLHADGGRYRPRILGYLKLLSEGAESRGAFVKSFGSDVDGFERAWRRYVMQLRPGPDEVCARNLRVLAFAAMSYYRDPTRFGSLERRTRYARGTCACWRLRRCPITGIRRASGAWSACAKSCSTDGWSGR